MRSCYRLFLRNATTVAAGSSSAANIFPRTVSYSSASTHSLLRHYCALQAPKNQRDNKKNMSLGGQNPARNLSLTTCVTGAAWSFAALLTWHRVLERVCDGEEFFGYNYSHPWWRAIIAATLVTLAAKVKDNHDIHVKFTNDILGAKANKGDEKSLFYLFKAHLGNYIDSKEIFILAFCAEKTGTLEILLDATKQMRPHYSKELLDAVSKHGSQQFRDTVFQEAKKKGLEPDNDPPSDENHSSHRARP